MVLGEILYRSRLQSGLSQREAALRADITPQYLSMIEHNKAMPSTPTLMRLNSVYAIDDARHALTMATYNRALRATDKERRYGRHKSRTRAEQCRT
jgi:transcriptional regulator with XRE-family HTH domain